MNYLKSSRNMAARPRAGCFLALFLIAGFPAMMVTHAAGLAATNTPAAIPWSEIGAKAGADYQGDGLAVTPTESGARLHCVFQRLDGEATPEGLWLTSTVTNAVSDRFRVTAMAVGRVTPCAPGAADRTFNIQNSTSSSQLEDAGIISVAGQTVRLSRPGLTEEYSVSMDGVRQDFIVEKAPPGAPNGELVVKLAVSGAQVEPAADGARPVRYPQQIGETENGSSLSHGARLVLAHSGRKIAYSRLRVTDATGKELTARIEAEPNSALRTPDSALGMAVVVNDVEAVYPVRIDPTFSDANWVSMGAFPGTDGRVNTAVADGSGNLYIGGNFTIVDNVLANNIAEWNGSSWSALSSGMDGPVAALAVSGGSLYASGDFSTAGGIAASEIAQWNGTGWSALGSGIINGVHALAVSGSTLYAGGSLTTAGGSPANNIAQWNGTSWSALGSGITGEGADGGGPFVYALAVSGGTLYAGGDFSTAGGSPANDIAQWNGSSWSPLGSGIGGFAPAVYALAVSGSTLYAGGTISTAGGISANNIAQWNGTSWSALGSGMDGPVEALAVSGGTVYAGGYFTTAGGSAANAIAVWNCSNWSALGSGMGGFSYHDVSALAVSGGTLYAGGDFSTAGGSTANDIAQWNGSSWSALGSGMNGLNSYVFALAASGSTLYAGGYFTMAGSDTNANYIAQWNGSSWSALGSGMDGPVYALAVSGGTLYADGYFTTAGGSAANGIAEWNGSSWSALGSGITGEGADGGGPFLYALAVSGGTLYAGGDFSTAGGSPANNIAQWNGSSWSALGSGITGVGADGGGPFVYALAASDSTLFAGGDFSTAGGSPANNIAQWNGSSWSALGSGITGVGADGGGPFVYALAASGGMLFAGGDFSTAGGSTATNIAQWNGSSWSPLGSGMNGTVSALAVSGSTLYAAGFFDTAGGSAANDIAQWNGSSWSALGSGMNATVSALAVSGSTLYAGGYFTTAGTNVSAWAALAYLPGSLAIITTNAAFGFTGGMFGFDVTGPSGASVVIQASTNLQTWIPLQTNLLGSGPLYFSDPQSSTKVRRFYRAVLSQ